jgi:hypothetical protein
MVVEYCIEHAPCVALGVRRIPRLQQTPQGFLASRLATQTHNSTACLDLDHVQSGSIFPALFWRVRCPTARKESMCAGWIIQEM